MRRLLPLAFSALLLLAACDGRKELYSYDLPVGGHDYRVTVFSDSTTELSLGGHVRLEGAYDTIYAFTWGGRDYLGADFHDGLMTVYTPELRLLMDRDMGISQVTPEIALDGGPTAFIYRGPDGRSGMLDADFNTLYPAEYDSIYLCSLRLTVPDVSGKQLELDTLYYVYQKQGGLRGVGSVDGRTIVLPGEYSEVKPFYTYYFKDYDCEEARANINGRRTCDTGDRVVVLGYKACTADGLFALYDLEGRLIVPQGADYAYPVYWSDPRNAKYWAAGYPYTASDGRTLYRVGIYDRAGHEILPPRYAMSYNLFGEDWADSQEEPGRHEMQFTTGFRDGGFVREIYDYNGNLIKQKIDKLFK